LVFRWPDEDDEEEKEDEEDEEESNPKLNCKTFCDYARKGYLMLSEEAKQSVLSSAHKLRNLVRDIIQKELGVNSDVISDDESIFDRFKSFYKNTSITTGTHPIIGKIRDSLKKVVAEHLMDTPTWSSSPIAHNPVMVHIYRSRFKGPLRRFICGCDMNDEERQKYPEVSQKTLKIILPTFDQLFHIDDFQINSILYGGGSDLSAYCSKRPKKTVIVMMKKDTVSLEAIYGSHAEREQKQKEAEKKTKSKSGKLRIPVSCMRGILNEKRYIFLMSKSIFIYNFLLK